MPVSGRCVAPKPSGPIAVGGGGASVAFKNPFDAETTFVCTTDNPAFIVTREETIGAKQTKQIGVRFEPREDGKAVRTAKLLVTSDRVPARPGRFTSRRRTDERIYTKKKKRHAERSSRVTNT